MSQPRLDRWATEKKRKRTTFGSLGIVSHGALKTKNRLL